MVWPSFTFRSAVAFVAITLFSCGGGGGGGGDASNLSPEAAVVTIEASPRVIEPGLYTEVKVHLFDVHPNGIILKLRFPVALKIVRNTPRLDVGQDTVFLTPLFQGTDGDALRYLVFSLPFSAFDENAQGDVVFKLQGDIEGEDLPIEVDADVNRRDVRDGQEFRVATPNFVAEDDIKVTVAD